MEATPTVTFTVTAYLDKLQAIERFNSPTHQLVLTYDQELALVRTLRAIKTTGFWNEFGPPIINGAPRPSCNPDALKQPVDTTTHRPA